MFASRTARFTTMSVAAASAMAGLVAPAHAGSENWRVVKVSESAGHQEFYATVATGKRRAWAFGHSVHRPVAERWNGRRWTPVALPSGLGGIIDTADASSAKNVWALGDRGDGGPSYALRWNGRKWAVSKRWPKLTTDVEALSARNVWVFGFSRAGAGTGTWHFNGRRWTKPNLGGLLLGRASAVSASDIWAVGTSPCGDVECGDRTVARYDGQKWKAVSTGDALPPNIPEPSPGKPAQHVFLADVAASSARNVWVTGWVYRYDDQGQWSETPLLVRWNGTAWAAVDLPSTDWTPRRILSDGKGGVWIVGSRSSEEPGGFETPLLHRTSGGTWTTGQIVGTDRHALVHDLARIPGTRSFWGAGSVAKTDEEPDAAIYRHP